MKKYQLLINLAELMEDGYEPQAGDVVYDSSFGHHASPITLTGTRHGTYQHLIGHSTPYAETVGYHLPKFYVQPREVVLVESVKQTLKNAIAQPTQKKALEAIQSLITNLSK